MPFKATDSQLIDVIAVGPRSLKEIAKAFEMTTLPHLQTRLNKLAKAGKIQRRLNNRDRRQIIYEVKAPHDVKPCQD